MKQTIRIIAVLAVLAISGCKTLDSLIGSVDFEELANVALSAIDGENIVPLDSVPEFTPAKPEEVKPTTEPQIPLIGLPVDAEIADLKIYKNKTTWRIVSGMKNWQKKKVKKDCNGIIYYFHQTPDGSWVGRKFDWVTPGQQSKDHKNIDGNYMKVIPKSGETWCLVITDVTSSKRTNVLTGVWP